MKKTLKVLVVIALTGFVLSLIAHFATYLGINPQKKYPFVWLLHIGVFIVFTPAVFIMKNMDRKGELFFLESAKYAPLWMKVICCVFLYMQELISCPF